MKFKHKIMLKNYEKSHNINCCEIFKSNVYLKFPAFNLTLAALYESGGFNARIIYVKCKPCAFAFIFYQECKKYLYYRTKFMVHIFEI